MSRKDSSEGAESALERVPGRQIFIWFPQPHTDPLTAQTTIRQGRQFFPQNSRSESCAATAEVSSAKTSRPAASHLTRLLPFVATKFVHGCVTKCRGRHHESTKGLEACRGGQVQHGN